MNTTERLLMTDTAAGTAYIQDWTLNAEGEVVDVTEVADLPMPALDVDDFDDVDPFHAAFEAAAIEAATDAGFDVRGHRATTTTSATRSMSPPHQRGKDHEARGSLTRGGSPGPVPTVLRTRNGRLGTD